MGAFAMVLFFATNASDNITPLRILSLLMTAVLIYLTFMLIRYKARGIIREASEGKE